MTKETKKIQKKVIIKDYWTSMTGAMTKTYQWPEIFEISPYHITKRWLRR